MKMTSLLFFISSYLLSFVLSQPSSDNLYFVFEHFRHGARSPTNGLNPNLQDLFGTIWEGNGELTKNGMIQQYIIGLRNRKRYD